TVLRIVFNLPIVLGHAKHATAVKTRSANDLSFKRSEALNCQLDLIEKLVAASVITRDFFSRQTIEYAPSTMCQDNKKVGVFGKTCLQKSSDRPCLIEFPGMHKTTIQIFLSHIFLLQVLPTGKCRTGIYP